MCVCVCVCVCVCHFTFGAMSILRPHREVEFYVDLANHQNEQYDATLREVKESMNTVYKEAGIKSPRLLLPSVQDMRITMSLSFSETGPMRSNARV